MKRILSGAIVALALLVWAMPAAAMSHDEPDPDKTINFSGEVRARWEYVDNADDADSDNDDSFDFFPYRARVAADGSFTENIFGKVEVQAFGFFGDDFSEKSFQNPLFEGFASDELFGQPQEDAEVSLYQAYIHLANIADSNWHVKLGRQEYTLGNELHFGDADWYNGISYDGVRGTWDNESWDLDLLYFIVDEFPGHLDFGESFDEQNELWGATVNFGVGEGDQYIEPYVINNRQTSDPGGVLTRTRAWMFGALWSNPVDMDNAWDWSLEAAIQSGEVGPSGAETDLKGMIVEGWLGYTFSDAHRVHLGLLNASGDDDPADSDFDGWIPLFPDEHAHNRLGDIDLFGGPSVVSSPITFFSGSGMSNVMDINGGYTWSGENKQFRAALHLLTLAEEFDPDGPGPIDGEDDLGQEIDLAYNYDVTRNVGFEVGYAHLLSGDLLDVSPTQEGDDVMRAWWQLRLQWN